MPPRICQEWVELSRFWYPGRFPNLPVIAMLKVYCDESHDEATYGLAGWIARPEEWDKFDLAWKAMLTKHHAPAFHAVEIVERDNIPDSRFKGWTFDQEKAIFIDAVDVVLDQNHCDKLMAVGCSISVAKWHEWIESKDAVWVLLFCRLLDLLIHNLSGETNISLMFDSKKEVREIVNAYYYNALESVERIRSGQLAPVVGFGQDEKIRPLQAADLFAYEWRKRSSDKVLRPTKVARRSYERLRERPADLKHYNSEAMTAIRKQAAAGDGFLQAMWNYPTTED